MANARPVISTNVGGVIDLLGPELEATAAGGWTVCERGMSVPPGDAAAFSSGLACLVRDARLRGALGDRGQTYVVRHYSKERLFRDVALLYEGLLAGPDTDEAPGPSGPTVNRPLILPEAAAP
jgi:glycosyltransferase involved in cell wall biosynthesis